MLKGSKMNGGMKMKKLVSILLVIALLFTIAACDSTKDKPAEPSESAAPVETEDTPVETEDVPAPSETEAEEKPDFSGKTLNVVATSDKYGPLFDKFTEATGAKVEFLSMSSGEVLSRVKAEGGTPMADLWFGGGLDAFMAAKDDGLLEQYHAKEADKVAPEYRDADGYWYAKGITVVGFMANNAVLEELGQEAPKTWEDIVKPEFKGEVIMSNPAISGTNYAAVKGLLDMFGDEGWNYLAKLNENIPFYGKRGKDPQEKTVAGEFAVGIIPVDKSAFDAAEEGDLTVVYPEDGIPWVPEGVAIFKNGANVDVAKAFIDFMLTSEAMEIIAELDGKDGAQMIVPGIKGFELGLPEDKLIKQDLSTFGSMREEILAQWEDMTKDKETK